MHGGIQDSEGAEPDLQLKRLSQVIKSNCPQVACNHRSCSVEQMLPLAKRCQPSSVIDTIKAFRCPTCEELKVPESHRQAAMPHAEKPNGIVGLDYVQVELKHEDEQGKMVEENYNVLTVVCLPCHWICARNHFFSALFTRIQQWPMPAKSSRDISLRTTSVCFLLLPNPIGN